VPRSLPLQRHCRARRSATRSTATLTASFNAVRKPVEETVQLLTRDELRAFLGALQARGSSSRGFSAGHLLTAEAMAASSPAVFWSMVREFEGDVEGGVAVLRAEL